MRKEIQPYRQPGLGLVQDDQQLGTGHRGWYTLPMLMWGLSCFMAVYASSPLHDSWLHL